jgi:HD-like signal output (HDOD) protein
MDKQIQHPDQVSAEQQTIDTRMRIEIRDIGIPPRPTILNEIDHEMEKDAPDFGVLAKLIGSDVALAAGLIKTTNSPFFGFSKKVRTIHEAMLVLGLKLVTRTIAGLALQKIFPYVPSLERFWDTSASTARASGWLAQRLRKNCAVRPTDAYTFALFRDCGIPVLLIPFPEYSNVLQQANTDEKQSFTAVEDQLLSINHASLGADLAESWLLPTDVHIGIRHHHNLAALNETDDSALTLVSRQLIAIAQIAEYLVQEQTGMNKSCEWDKLGDTCLNIVNLTREELADVLDEYRMADFSNN